MDITKSGELIGGGLSKSIYVDTHDVKKVIAEFHEPETRNVNMMKGYYCLWKMAHLLFPENYPDVYMAASGKKSLLQMQRMDVDSEHVEMTQLGADRKNRLTNRTRLKDLDRKFRAVYQTKEFRNLLQSIKEAGLPEIDIAPRNISKSPKGDYLILDLEDPWDVVLETVNPRFDEKRLREAIKKLPDEHRARAESLFQRLLELVEEERVALSSKKK